MKHKPKLDTKKIAKSLGAEHRGKVAAKGGHFGAMQLVAKIQSRFLVPQEEVARRIRTGQSAGWYPWRPRDSPA